MQRVLARVVTEPRAERYNVKKESQGNSEELTEDTQHMISSDQDLQEFPGYRLIIAMMAFTSTFIVLFYVPQPLFAILHFLTALSDSSYDSLSTTYTVILTLIFICVNLYFYY